jgi:iron complex outermembrane receptor protein
MRRRLLTISVSLAAMTLAGTAQAQEAPAEDASEGLQDIIVTAQRREESLQRAAIAVDVVQGDELSKAGVTDVTTLGNLTPALTVEPSSTGNLLFVRGVGNFTLVPTSDPAIAFNYDGVYIGRPTSTSGAFFDLDRIEVLKGPQGTLYGRNATGGAINVIPTRPKPGEFSGYATASYASYENIFVEGAINAPMGENGAIRVSGALQDRNGYYKDGTADDQTQALRVQMLAELTPELTVRFAGDYFHQGGAGASVTYLGRYQYAGSVAGYVFVPSNLPRSEGLYTPAAQAFRRTGSAGPAGRNLTDLAPYPFRDNNFYGVNAEIAWESEIGTLTLIPAFRVSQLDYLADAAAFIARTRETDEQFSLEARFAGNRIGIFDYTLGALYYDETIDVKNGGIFIAALASISKSKLTTKSLAPFGRLTANVTDRLRIVGGVRYTRDRKTYHDRGTSGTIVCQIVTPAGPSCPNAPLFPYVDSFSQLPFPFPAAGGPPAVPVGGGAIVVRSERNQNNRLTNSRMTWRAAIEFDLAPRSLVYASVETGFRSGGFSSALGFETYDPEYITAYTIGSKNRLFDNRLQLNIEGFYWKYRDQQVNFVGLDLAGRTANQTRNIGSSTIKGVEVESAFLVTPTTLLSANVQYLDTTTKSFVYSTGNTVPPPLTGCAVRPNSATLVNVDCSGFPAYNSPKWTVNLSAQQTIEVGDYGLTFSVDTQYKTKRYISFQYLPQQLEGSTWSSNAQISFGPSDGQWSIAGFVRNIENDRTPTFQTLAPVTNFLVASTTAPRTYGVRASVKF